MAIHSNLGSLNQFIQSGNNLAGMQLSNGKTVMAIMVEEAKRLEGILIEEIQGYYDSYAPIRYERTMNLLNSTRVGEPVIINGAITIQVYFDDAMAYHPSVMKNGSPGYVPYLLSHGYSWANPSGYEDHFTNYSGFKFITKTIERFNSENPYGIKIIAMFNGEPYVE